jgi:hypothetical protein
MKENNLKTEPRTVYDVTPSAPAVGLRPAAYRAPQLRSLGRVANVTLDSGFAKRKPQG